MLRAVIIFHYFEFEKGLGGKNQKENYSTGLSKVSLKHIYLYLYIELKKKKRGTYRPLILIHVVIIGQGLKMILVGKFVR